MRLVAVWTLVMAALSVLASCAKVVVADPQETVIHFTVDGPIDFKMSDYTFGDDEEPVTPADVRKLMRSVGCVATGVTRDGPRTRVKDIRCPMGQASSRSQP